MVDRAVIPQLATPSAATVRPRTGRESLSEAAYARIREMVIALELAPGSLIDERALAERLGLGLTPVRQALRRLEWENFVVILPRRGTLVTDISRDDLGRIFELRGELESLAARLAAANATKQDVAGMRAILSLATAAASAGRNDHRQLIELDRELHRSIAAASANHMLERTVEWLYGHVLRLWNVSLAEVPGLPAAVGDHRAVVDAIEAGDGERSSALMRAHVERFQATFAGIEDEPRAADRSRRRRSATTPG